MPTSADLIKKENERLNKPRNSQLLIRYPLSIEITNQIDMMQSNYLRTPLQQKSWNQRKDYYKAFS